jgi:hypothetical protein
MQIRKSRKWMIVVAGLVAVLGLSAAAGAGWYIHNLSAVNAGDQTVTRVNITSGMTAPQVASALEEKKLIRSRYAFLGYIKLKRIDARFNVGVYAVKPSQSTPEIIKHLIDGQSDEVAVRFYPDGTLRGKDYRSVESALKKAGYNDADIETAFKADYDSYVFKSRPTGADLEGFVYGDTYFMSGDATAKSAIQRALSEFDQVARKNNLEEKFKKRGLTLYQGITLASIVQKESIGCGVGTEVCEDQRKIASVFYNRMKAGMNLGSDVTYQYAADKLGVTRDTQLDSPYNTRVHKGLPPGPIATPGLSALNAVADPAQTDYLFFLSGDDNITYFAKTDAEHTANTKAHCHQKCQQS